MQKNLLPADGPPEAPAAPESPQAAPININVNGGEVEKKKTDKKETYIPSQEDELLENMTRFMSKLNEQD